MQFMTWTFDREVAEALRRCSLIDLIGVPYWAHSYHHYSGDGRAKDTL